MFSSRASFLEFLISHYLSPACFCRQMTVLDLINCYLNFLYYPSLVPIFTIPLHGPCRLLSFTWGYVCKSINNRHFSPLSTISFFLLRLIDIVWCFAFAQWIQSFSGFPQRIFYWASSWTVVIVHLLHSFPYCIALVSLLDKKENYLIRIVLRFLWLFWTFVFPNLLVWF